MVVERQAGEFNESELDAWGVSWQKENIPAIIRAPWNVAKH